MNQFHNSLLSYVAKCAEHCDFQDKLDEAICDKFVCGLCNETMQKRLLAEKNLTLATAIEIAQGMEAASKQTTELQAGSGQSQSHEIQLVSRTAATKSKKKCYCCGRAGHLPSVCHFSDQKCRSCGKIGQIAKVCNSLETPHDKQQSAQRYYSSRPQQQPQCSNSQQARYVEGDASENAMTDSNEWGILTVHQLERTQPSINIELKVNNTKVVKELDIGASLTIMSEKIQQRKLPNLELQPSAVTLTTYSGEQLKVLRQAQVKVVYKTQ